jgi:hypothetical protein
MYKYLDAEHTQVTDGNGRTIPVNHRLFREEIQPWINEGNEIEPFVEPLEDPINALRAKRDSDLASVVVNINGVNIWANPREEQNISGRLRQMDISGATECKWVQGSDIYLLTKSELETVLVSGTTQCAKIYDDYIAALEAL